MVKRFLAILHKEISGLHQAAYLLAAFAFGSQILALFRDRLLAARFGAGDILDLYYSAFRIPDFLFATVASLVSLSVLIPFLMKEMDTSEDGNENIGHRAKNFIDDVFSFFFWFMILVAGLAFVTAPFFLKILFPEFSSPEKFPVLVGMTRLLLLSPIFLGFSNLLASITQIRRRFFIYAVSPVVYNVGIILGVIFLYPVFGIYGLGLGVVFGAFLHFAVQTPFVIGQNLFPKLKLRINFQSIRRVVYTSFPRTLTVSSNELAELFLISFASFLLPGSVSIFNFSFNLQSVPFSIIGVSYSLAAFPTLTRHINDGRMEKFVEQMITSSRHIIFWSVPVMVEFVVLRAQIVRVILGSGRFNWNDTRLVAAALAVFVFSLVAQNMVPLFVRSFYSRGKTMIPLFMNIISACIIVLSSYFLVNFFIHNRFFKDFVESILKVSDIPGTVVLMLPLGFTIGVFINLIIHWVGFSMEFPSYSRPVWKTIFQVGGASLIMGYVTYFFLNIFDGIFGLNTLIGVFSQGFFSGIFGIISGVIVLFLLRNEELAEVWSTLHKKIWQAKVVGPDASME
jgi:putative peptidoglycan lipid II flippase